MIFLCLFYRLSSSSLKCWLSRVLSNMCLTFVMSSSTFPALSLSSGSGLYIYFTQNDLSIFSKLPLPFSSPTQGLAPTVHIVTQALVGTHSGSYPLPIPHLSWFKPSILSHLGPCLFSCLVSWLPGLFLKDHPCCCSTFLQGAAPSRKPSLTSSSHLPIPVLHPCSWPSSGFPRLGE